MLYSKPGDEAFLQAPEYFFILVPRRGDHMNYFQIVINYLVIKKVIRFPFCSISANVELNFQSLVEL